MHPTVSDKNILQILDLLPIHPPKAVQQYHFSRKGWGVKSTPVNSYKVLAWTNDGMLQFGPED